MNTADVLFTYLKDILYEPEKAQIDMESLPDDYKKLALGLQCLNEWVLEAKNFAKAISKGDLSITPPTVDNMLAAPIKDMHASLIHLTWQTKQVAKGDYKQRVDFMGEFSESFNTMIMQLEDRDNKLRENNKQLRQNLELVESLTNYTNNMIFVFSRNTGENIYKNQTASWYCDTQRGKCTDVLRQLSAHVVNEGRDNWEVCVLSGGDDSYFKVESFTILWSGEEAVVHILADDTIRHEHEKVMYDMAYIDPLTGLHNRRYALDRMVNYIESGEEFCITYIDVDNLKYVNDKYGHDNGDVYLRKVSSMISGVGGELCRVGGDEFLLISRGMDLKFLDERLSELGDMLCRDLENKWQMGFSHATVMVPKDPEYELEAYIKEADRKMYERKKLHHRQRIDKY